MISKRLYDRFYADERHDGTKYFYNWIRSRIQSSMTLVNLGAGPATGSELRSFRGLVSRVIGADIDPAVLKNDELDEAVLIENGRMPLADETADVIVSDFVLEHVERPAQFLADVYRVLRPGGSYFFRTPNLYNYVSLIARSTPHWFHERVANRARGLNEKAHDPYPTFHRLNTARSIRRHSSRAGFGRREIVMFEGPPVYLSFATLPFLMGVTYERLVNAFD